MTGVITTIPRFQFLDANGNPLVLGTLTVYLAGTTTPSPTWQDSALSTLNTNPVVMDARGECVLWLDSTKSYKFVLKNAAGVTQWTQDNISGADAHLRGDLAASSGASLVGFDPELNYVAGTLGAAVQDDLINVMWFMSEAQRSDVKARTYTQDVTAVVQAVIDLGLFLGRGVYAPGGGYKLTAGLSIINDLTFVGDGGGRTVFNIFSASVTAGLTVAMPDNSSFISGNIGGFGIICNSGAAICDGLVITTTAINSAVSQSRFHDMYIINPRDGVRLDGVIYMSEFSGITVTGVVTRYGWYADSAKEIIYNTYKNLEVTGVQSAAYAYWIRSDASIFTNLTCDGCCHFKSFYGHVMGLSVEGISAAATPSVIAIQTDQLQSLSDVAIINVPNAKCSIGINAVAVGMNISNIRVPDAGAGNQPDAIILWSAGNTGTLSNVVCDRAPVSLLEDSMVDSTLNGFVITACDSVTKRALSYKEGSWTPGFASWTIAPTVASARYVKVGRVVNLFLNFYGGSCANYSTITGIPFTSSTVVGGTAQMVSGEPTIFFSAKISTNATEISGISAQNLTAPRYCQLTATYRTDK